MKTQITFNTITNIAITIAFIGTIIAAISCS